MATQKRKTKKASSIGTLNVSAATRFFSTRHRRLRHPWATLRTGVSVQTVASFAEPWEAHLLRGRLWAEDIPAFVAFGFHVGNNWIAGLALGGAKVQVPEGFGDAARTVLRQAQLGAYKAELEDELGPIPWIVCPHCGARDYCAVRAWPMSALSAIVVVATGVAFFADTSRLRCRVCRTRWNPGPYL